MALGNPSKPSGCSNHVLKQKLKREHHLKGALQNQSSKHQNSQKLSALASVNFDVCSIDFVVLRLNGVPFSIFVLNNIL